MILNALIEEWPGEFGVFIHELPGFYVGALSHDEALGSVPDAVEGHLAWLVTHGFVTNGSEPVEIEIAEHLTAVNGRKGPLFERDRLVATRESVDRALAVAALARRDLVDLYRSVSVVRREQTSDDGGWTMADHLRHIAAAEVFYVDTLTGQSGLQLPDDPVKAMQTSALHADSVLRALADSDRFRVFERSGEEWTAGKVLRRMTAHLREHYPWLQTLASS